VSVQQTAQKFAFSSKPFEEARRIDSLRPAADAPRPKSIDRYSEAYEDEEKLEAPRRGEDSPPLEIINDFGDDRRYDAKKSEKFEAIPKEQTPTNQKQLDIVSGPESSVQVMEGQSYIQDDEDMDEYIEDDLDASSPKIDLDGKGLAKGSANAPINDKQEKLPATSIDKFSNKSKSV